MMVTHDSRLVLLSLSLSGCSVDAVMTWILDLGFLVGCISCEL